MQIEDYNSFCEKVIRPYVDQFKEFVNKEGYKKVHSY